MKTKKMRTLLGAAAVLAGFAIPLASTQTATAQTAAQGPFTFPAPVQVSPNWSLSGTTAASGAVFIPGITPQLLATVFPPNLNELQNLHVYAAGTQDYVCRANAVGSPAWAFLGPRANLYQQNLGRQTLIGDHYNLQGTSDAGSARDGPRWRFFANSPFGQGVIRGRLARSTPSNLVGAIPHLNLTAEAESGTTKILQIVRTSTVGGVAPIASACTASAIGTISKVPYSTSYIFFRQLELTDDGGVA